MNREDWGSLAAFAVIAEERSFARAAARLGVSASALSHSMRNLEQRLNVRLLSRSTRNVTTTEAGELLLASLQPALADITRAVDNLSRLSGRPSGLVRITAPRQAARAVIGPKLPQFAIDFPDVVVEIRIEQAFVDIIEQRVDAGVRLGESVAKDMISVRISADQRIAVVGSPLYFKKNAFPTHPQDLNEHRCIGFRATAGGAVFKWDFEKRGKKVEVVPTGGLICNDEGMMIDSVLADSGLAYVFEDLVTEQIEKGNLVRVLEDWCPAIPGFYLYYPSRRQTPAALGALIEALRVAPGRQ
jgi:DNA-binding transcriptional LysR family regulator